MKRSITRSILVLIIFIGCSGMVSKPVFRGSQQPALIVLAEQRFNPTVQRLMALEDIKALPIGNTGMFFVIPVQQDPMLEELQIRYLEELIKKLEVNEPSGD